MGRGEGIDQGHRADCSILFVCIFFVHFGIPKEIVTDGGPQFTSNLIQKLIEKYKIYHQITLPYHPQVNGYVESTNKFIEGIITKIVDRH